MMSSFFALTKKRSHWRRWVPALIAVFAAAEAAATTVVAPKWLDIPAVDGQCRDRSYAHGGSIYLVDPAGTRKGHVKVLHSGVDFYVCIGDIPSGDAKQVIVAVDGQRSAPRSTHPGGHYLFTVTSQGRITVARANASGRVEPLAWKQREFAARVFTLPNKNWSAELRIRLDWLGGYARTDALYLAVARQDGAIVGRWPASAQLRAKQTWGELEIAPHYRHTVNAGSAFVDGRGGYFVVPDAPEFNPAEITIQSWIRVSEDSCGPLISHGYGYGYWLAVCKKVMFGHAGASTTVRSQADLPSGWHNIAVTMDEEGLRKIYVDGNLEVQVGWNPIEWPVHAQQEESHSRLAASDAPLRIGADLEAPPRTKCSSRVSSRFSYMGSCSQP